MNLFGEPDDTPPRNRAEIPSARSAGSPPTGAAGILVEVDAEHRIERRPAWPNEEVKAAVAGYTLEKLRQIKEENARRLRG